MRTNRALPLFALILLCSAGNTFAQAVSPLVIADAHSRQLQSTYLKQLEVAGQKASALKFPYHFYLNHKLDISEKQQQNDPSASIQFENFRGEQVLAITGNYYASYSATLMNQNQRVRQTFEDVILPILKVTAPEFGRDVPFAAFAMEISHHVRQKVLGVETEGVENILLVLPRSATEHLIAANSVDGQQSALLEGAIYLDGEPIPLWLGGDEAPQPVKDAYLQRLGPSNADSTETAGADSAMTNSPMQPEAQLDPTFSAEHETSTARIGDLQNEYRDPLNLLVAQLDPQAHFVKYAPPVFIALHGCIFLQLSTTATLAPGVHGSRYQLAALAFDENISQLIRPTLKFIPVPDFEGIDFSATVTAGDQVEAVEYVIPFSKLRCIRDYDCTVQQALNSSLILINGERVDLNLERDEAGLH